MTISLSEEQFEHLRAAVQSQTGKIVTGNTFTDELDGVNLTGTFNAGELEVVINKKPFFLKQAYIEAGITNWIRGHENG